MTYSGVPAGTFTLTAKPFKKINNRKAYHIEWHALSSKVFSLFYRLNDYIYSFIDYEGLFSHKFSMHLDESKQKRTSVELHDYGRRQTFFWDRRNHYKKGFSQRKTVRSIPLWGQDTLSALYYIRMVKLPPVGKSFSFPLITQTKTWEAVVHVVRKEKVRTPMGEVNTVVLKPETKFKGILRKRGDSFIWLTDDDRRIMVKFVAKVKIGSVKAALKKVLSLGQASNPKL